MKKLFIALAVVFVLAGCAPIVKPSSNVVHFYYSSWKEVDLSQFSAAAAKDTDLDAATQAQADYNATHTDDQMLGPYLGDGVPIEEAPDAMIYIVNADTLKVYYQATIPRGDLVSRRNAINLALDSMADPDTGIIGNNALYVDNIPPSPPAPPVPKLWVALLDTTAKIVYYSEHYNTEAEAIQRYQLGMAPQADQYNRMDIDDGVDVPGHVWQAYIGETEAHY